MAALLWSFLSVNPHMALILLLFEKVSQMAIEIPIFFQNTFQHYYIADHLPCVSAYALHLLTFQDSTLIFISDVSIC